MKIKHVINDQFSRKHYDHYDYCILNSMRIIGPEQKIKYSCNKTKVFQPIADFTRIKRKYAKRKNE